MAGSNSVLEQLGSLFRGVIGAEDGVHMRVWNELKPWMGSLGQSAMRKWIPRIQGGNMCEVPILQRGRVVGECDHFGMAECEICHRPVCLSHALIDQDANAICFICMGDARQTVPIFQRERARQQQNPKARPQQERQQERDQQRQQQNPHNGKQPPNALQVLEALTRLELKPNATWDEIKVAHRRLSAKLHPDRGKTAKEKAKLNAKFVEVQKALDLLKQVYPDAA
jgi:DnaJ domain